MKNKIIVLLLVMTIFLTGCTAVRIKTDSIDNIISVVLSKDNKLYNRIGKGYKYYVPRGVTYIDSTELNDKLYSNGIYYYLYIDAVNYFYKNKIDYTEKKDVYYSKKIDGDKEGYLEITKQDDNKYLINYAYNYARIEALVSEEKINDVVLDLSYILSTIKFNDNIIELMLNEEYFTNKEEQFKEFTKDGLEENTEVEEKHFLEYKDDEEEYIESE